MIPLQPEYKKDGLLRRVLSRDGDIAIAATHNSGRVVNYEVWIVQSSPDRTAVYNGKETHIAASEFTPSSASWGVKGWTFKTHDQAIAKAVLVKHEQVLAAQRKHEEDIAKCQPNT